VVRFEPPEGRPLSRGEVPVLFAMLDELRARGRVPRIHQVLLDPQFNAAMYQRPRFGLLGGSRNYLILGLPYLLANTTEQLRSVVAHELGHLAGAHGRFGAWIYRVRRIWGQLQDKLDRGELRMQWLFGPFIRRYFPYFNAYSFALARLQEREADRFAAEVTSPRAAAEGLVVAHVLGGFLHEEFLPALYARASDEPEVPDVHREMLRCFRSISPSQAEQYREAALAETPEMDDTHPSLSQRLEALGQADLPMPPAPERTAAEHYLGGQFAALVAAFDQQWRSEREEKWRAAYTGHQARRQRLAELQARHDAGEAMGADEAFEHADLDLFGNKSTVRGVYLLVLAHGQEHLGQSIAYARSNSITPPWTERRAAKAEAKK
jgi:Zn-dependent protease with chaperone function